MPIKKFVLTQNRINISRALEGYVYRHGLVCCLCGKQLKVGDIIISKYGSKVKVKWYCLNCALKLYFVKQIITKKHKYFIIS